MQMRAIATGVITVDLYREDCALLARICQVARESDVLANGTGDAAATLGALFALGAVACAGTLNARPVDLAATRDDLARLEVCVA